MHPLFDLTGKIAIVTNCAAELARGMVSGLAEAGADIVGIDSQLPTEAQAIAQEFGRQFVWVEGDLSDLDGIPAIVKKAIDIFGKVDILVDYSGYTDKSKEADAMTWEEYVYTVDVNQNALARVAMEVYRKMKAQGTGGKIVMVSSARAFRTARGGFAYTTSKNGVLGLAKGLGIDGAQYGIWVNAIAPGVMETQRVRDAYTPDSAQKAQEVTQTMLPAHRLGNSDDLRGAVVFLASKASDFLVGQVIGIDGGYVVRH